MLLVPGLFLFLNSLGVETMSDNYKTSKIFRNLLDDSTIELTNKCFTYTEKSAFYLWDVLETQRSKVDPKKESEIYETLSSIAECMFDMWISIKAHARDSDSIEILMFLEKEV